MKYLTLPFFILVSLAAGWIGSVFTMSEIGTWYAALEKPFWNPPSSVFGPVWTLLYVLMGTAAYLVSRSPKLGKYPVLWLFLAHLLVNLFWSVAFFGMHEVLLALLVIILLIGLIALLMRLYWRHSRAAVWLMAPYLLWVLFATSLNAAILVLNYGA
jgi:benzodiazapine receptor